MNKCGKLVDKINQRLDNIQKSMDRMDGKTTETNAKEGDISCLFESSCYGNWDPKPYRLPGKDISISTVGLF